MHAWDQMRIETAHNLVDLMEECIEAVIASEGGYKRFFTKFDAPDLP
jgi:hypothetical protein